MPILAHFGKRLLLLTAFAIALLAKASAQSIPPLVFEPGFEGEIWQRLPVLGERVGTQCVPRWLFDPAIGTFTPDPDIQGDNPPTWDPANPPSAVLNDDDDGVICDPAVDDIPLGEMLYPYDVATWQAPGNTIDPTTGFPIGYRIFVSDSSNNRILAFGPDAAGTLVPITLASADWTGKPSAAFCSTELENPNCFATMSRPDGIDVDDAGFVWVADGGGNRVMVFDNDGVWQATYMNDGYMYGLDVAPGSAYGVAGGRVAFISIAPGDQTSLTVIDSGTLAVVGRFTSPPTSNPNGMNISTDVAYHVDPAGTVRLAVADWANGAIKVFGTTDGGAPVQDLDLLFGPAEINLDPASTLQEPYRVAVDGRGRFLVADTANQRLAVFKPDFSTPVATVAYLFHLDAAGGLNGFPRGAAEDRIGRLLIADLANHKIEMFQMPDLAIVDPALDTVLLPVGDPVTVSFSVTVPETKSQVVAVVPTCQVIGPATMQTAVPVLIGAPANTPDGTTLPTILAGEIYRYSCMAKATAPGELVFTVGAAGNPTEAVPAGVTVAPPRTVTARVQCEGCETVPPTIDSSVVTPPSPVANAAGWYRGAVTVRLTAADNQSGIGKVFWRWSGPMAATLTPCTPGADYACASVSPVLPTVDIDLVAAIQGTSTIEYWTEDDAFNASDPPGTLELKIDSEEPSTTASFTGGGIVPSLVTVHPVDVGSLVAATFYSVSSGGNIVEGPAEIVGDQVLVDNPGSTIFTYWSVDNAGNVETPHELALLFTNLPAAAADVVTIDEDSPTVYLDVLANDIKGEGALINRFNGSLPPASQATVEICQPVTVIPTPVYDANCAENIIKFTPAPNFNGLVVFGYNFENATDFEAHGDVIVTVNPVNDPPDAVDDTASVAEDTPLLIDEDTLLGNDVDVDINSLGQGDTLVVVSVGAAVNGSVSFDNDTNFVTFTPALDFVSAPGNLASFTYTLSDLVGETSTATVSIAVNAVNDPPVAADHDVATDEDTALSVAAPGLLAGATDVEGNPLTVTAAGPAAHGSLSFAAGGSYLYTPELDYFGPDSFSFTVSDGAGGSGNGNVTINVRPVNDAPIGVADAITIDEDAGATFIDVLANDSDVEGALVVSAVTQPGLVGGVSPGSVSFTAGGVTFSPAANFAGTASLTYTARDTGGLTVIVMVTVTVTAANDAPTALNKTYSTNEDTTLNVAVAAGLLAGASDPDAGDILSATAVTSPAHGSLSVNADGSFSYAPHANYFGPDSFDFSVSDNHSASITRTVSITVVAVNDAPVANADAATAVPDGSAFFINVLANDTDADGGTLVVTAVTQGSGGTGTVTFTPAGVTFKPSFTYAGSSTFSYTISDGAGGVSTATVTVTGTVVITNRPPVCTAVASPAEIWPPNHKKLYNVNVLGVTDPDFDPITITIAGIYQDEPVDTTGDGRFSPDGGGVGTSTAWVRGERMGSGNGRVYEIRYRATDSKGDSCTGTVYTTVPKSKGQPWQVIDSHVRYDSTATVPGTHDKDRDGADHDDECDRDHDHNGDGRHDREDHDRHHDDCRNAWNGHGRSSRGFVASWNWR